jgi:hypothetical protein
VIWASWAGQAGRRSLGGGRLGGLMLLVGSLLPLLVIMQVCYDDAGGRPGTGVRGWIGAGGVGKKLW